MSSRDKSLGVVALAPISPFKMEARPARRLFHAGVGARASFDLIHSLTGRAKFHPHNERAFSISSTKRNRSLGRRSSQVRSRFNAAPWPMLSMSGMFGNISTAAKGLVDSTPERDRPEYRSGSCARTPVQTTDFEVVAGPRAPPGQRDGCRRGFAKTGETALPIEPAFGPFPDLRMRRREKAAPQDTLTPEPVFAKLTHPITAAVRRELRAAGFSVFPAKNSCMMRFVWSQSRQRFLPMQRASQPIADGIMSQIVQSV